MSSYTILDDLEEGVQIIDPNLRYVYLNKTLLREVRMEAEDIIGRSMVEKFPGIDRTEIYQNIIDCLANGGVRKLVNEFKFPDDRHTFYEIRMQRVADGVILFTRDITATKKGEILLRETNKELEQFAHIAAHDMREPVRRIAILCEELLLDHEMSEEAQVVCEQLEGQARALMRLISDFRNLSGLGGKTLKREEFSILDLAKKTAAPFSEAFKAKEIAIHWPEFAPNVSAHPSLVGVLLRNLIENALKYGTGDVHFSVKEGQPSTFMLSNLTSSTSPSKDIFLPFVTGDKRTGTGLGLAICKKVVTKHQGKIWSDQSGERFCVSFTLEPDEA